MSERFILENDYQLFSRDQNIDVISHVLSCLPVIQYCIITTVSVNNTNAYDCH
jgi:hypothetical protein